MSFKKTLISVFLFALTLNVPLLAQTPEDLLAMMAEYSQAVVDHDLDKVMSYYADDVLIDMSIYPGPSFGMGPWRGGWAQRFQVPGWHTDHGIILAAENIVVVDHNSVMPESPGVPAMTSPHFDVIDFAEGKIVHQFVYGGGFTPPELPPAVPESEVPAPAPSGLSPMEANAQFVAQWNSHDAAAVASMQHAEAKIFVGCLNRYVSRGEMMAINQAYFEAIPDISLDVARSVDFGEGWVLTEFVMKGTQTQAFMGVPAMGYPVELNAVQLVQVDTDGLIANMRLYYFGNLLLDQMATPPDYSPVGTWVVSVPTPAGTIRMIHTVSPQEKAGGGFAGSLDQVNKNPTLFDLLPEDADYYSDWVTQNIWKGRNTIVGTNLAYGAKYGEGPLAETSVILVAHTEWTLTGPETNEGTAVMGVYLAAQDADDDGFPDPGQEPVICMPFDFTSKRLRKLPVPCIPDLQ